MHMPEPNKEPLIVRVGRHIVREFPIGAIKTEDVISPDPQFPDLFRVAIKTLAEVESIFYFKSHEAAEHLVADIRDAKTSYEDVQISLTPEINQHLLHPDHRS